MILDLFTLFIKIADLKLLLDSHILLKVKPIWYYISFHLEILELEFKYDTMTYKVVTLLGDSAQILKLI